MPESLDAPQARTGLESLLKRCLWACMSISVVILAISILPYPKNKQRDPECGITGHHLRHVLVLHRHGERSPVRWYDFEGKWAWAPQDIGIGKLTVTGIKEGFRLGQKLREKYNIFDTESITSDSTEVNRTIDTANAVLLGLLSRSGAATTVLDQCPCRPEHGMRSSPDCLASCIQLSPVPKVPRVNIRKRKNIPLDDQDPSFYQGHICKGYDAYRTKLETSEEWKTAAKTEFPDASSLVSKVHGSPFVKSLKWPSKDCIRCMDTSEPNFNYLAFMETVWSNLVCYDTIQEPYSTIATNKELLKVLNPVAQYTWKRRFSAEAGKYAGGALLYEWLQKLQDSATFWGDCHISPHEAKCKGAGGPQMSLYSAHDTTVYSLLAALAATDKSPLPGYVGHVVAELWESHQHPCPGQEREEPQFSVVLRYAPGVSPYAASYEDDKLTVSPFCPGGECSLISFVKETANVVVSPDMCDRVSTGVDHLFEMHESGCCSAEKP